MRKEDIILQMVGQAREIITILNDIEDNQAIKDDRNDKYIDFKDNGIWNKKKLLTRIDNILIFIEEEQYSKQREI